jgi:DNA polymerase-3 subunit gamma/tau
VVPPSAALAGATGELARASRPESEPPPSPSPPSPPWSPPPETLTATLATAPAPTAVVPAPATARREAPAAAKPEPEPATVLPPVDSSALDLTTARKVWPDLLKKVGATLAWRLSQVEPVAVVAPDVLVIAANAGYNSVADECGTAESLARIEQTLRRLTHRSVTVRYERSPEADDLATDARALDERRQDSLAADPLVERVVELFEARPHQLDFDGAETSSS